MRDRLENVWEWFLNQSTPVKAGIGIGVCIIIILLIFFLFPSDAPLSGDALVKYKDSCVSVSFNDLNGNMTKYKGQHLKFTGQIVQIKQNNGRTEIVMSITPIPEGWSSTNLIFVTYNSQTEFKQGDIINVYGEISGTYNYFTSSIGQLILVKITARFIELAPITGPTMVIVPFTNPQTNTSNITNNSSTLDNQTNPNNTNNPSVQTTKPTTTAP